MIRRFWSALLVLCFVVVGLVVTPPAATATTTWPVDISGTRMGVVSMLDDDRMLSMPCDSTNTYIQAAIVAPGETTSSLPVGAPWTCWGTEQQTYGTTGNGKTIYSPRVVDGVPHISAYKNGRVLWSTATTSELDCVSGSGVDYGMMLRSVSVGTDGNIYGVLRGYLGPSSLCGNYLVSYNSQTGAERFRVSLPNPSAEVTMPRVWTYPSKVLLVDASGMVREYGYDGVENTAKQYQFPFSSIRLLEATNAGRVFAIGTNSTSSIEEIRSHDSDGTNADMPFPSAYGWINWYGVSGGGELFGYKPNGSIYTFDLASDTETVRTLTKPAGYTRENLLQYYQASDGTGVAIRAVATTSWQYAISVDLIDSVSGTPTNVLWVAHDTTDVSQPGVYAGATQELYRNGYLYLPICRNSCGEAPGTEDLWLYKVDLTALSGIEGVGNARHAPYESDKLEYVAMGDSFSSGEGNPPFLLGTDRADDTGTATVDEENRCHRSEDAYPMLLEEDEDLDLDLTAFVACSGATTDTLINGGTEGGSWGEGSQLDALSESTDIVTITIGGNDVGFADALKKCIFLNEMPETWEYTQEAYDRSRCAIEIESAQSKINGYTLLGDQTFKAKLKSTFEAILDKVGEEARVYVIGYPNLFPEYEEIPTPSVCIWGVNSTYGGLFGVSSRIVNEEEVGLLRAVGGELNTVTSVAVDEVDDARLSFVDVRTAFENHEVCSYSPYISQITLPDQSGSYHPNAGGLSAYFTTIGGELD